MNKFSSKQIIFIIIAIALIFGVSIYSVNSLKKRPAFDFVQVKKADIIQQVRLSGQVNAAENLQLAFQKGGQIAKVNVKTGDKVKKGQILLQLDARDANVALSTSKAALETAKANYQKLQNGAVNADVEVSKTTLENAKQNLENIKEQQDTLVSNAYSALLNSTLAPAPGSGNVGSVNPIITGTYTGSSQGQYLIKLYSSGNGLMFETSGLESASGQANTNPQPMGNFGLYIQFPNSINLSGATGNTWTVSVPNTQASNYVANYNAYQSALQAKQVAINGAQAQVNSAQAALELKQNPPRQEDIDIAKAQVDSASAQVQSAQNNYDNSQLTAPMDGIITNVDAKTGEIASVGKPVVSMISQQKFEVETYLSEADLGKIKIGDPATVTLDAYGTNTTFNASVLSIDPSATTAGGNKTYKTTLQFSQDDERIKDGLGANVVITDEKHSQTLVVPSGSILNDNNKEFVLTSFGKQITQQPVQTGISSLDGYIEITSGLNEGNSIVDLGK